MSRNKDLLSELGQVFAIVAAVIAALYALARLLKRKPQPTELDRLFHSDLLPRFLDEFAKRADDLGITTEQLWRSCTDSRMSHERQKHILAFFIKRTIDRRTGVTDGVDC